MWIARVFSGLLIALSLTAFIIYEYFPEQAGTRPEDVQPLTAEAIVGLSIGGLGLLGLGLAWKWPLPGAIFALVAFFILGIIEPMLFQSPAAYVYPISALLFVLLWAKNKDMF